MMDGIHSLGLNELNRHLGGTAINDGNDTHAFVDTYVCAYIYLCVCVCV